MATANLRRGYVLGLTAYVIWGLFPLYFKLLERIPAVEIIVQRAVWSALFGAVLLLFWKHRAGGASCARIRSASSCWPPADC